MIIAGAGGAAHLPGMTAALTSLPVFGVPVESKALSGQDSLYSIVQMPPGVPVGTLAIGKAGAINAALLAASVLALSDPALGDRLEAWRQRQTAAVAEAPKDIKKDDIKKDSARDRRRARARARSHDRNPRQRPARPYACARRRAARLQVPHLRARS